MYYTIGEISKKLNISQYTLRYYSNMGLLPFVERSDNGNRLFKEEDCEWLYVIDCLKMAGMSLKDIKTFVDWVLEGDTTIEKRLQLFKDQINAVQSQIERLHEAMDILRYKQWYYETASAAGSTWVPESMSREEVPEELRKVRDKLTTMPEESLI